MLHRAEREGEREKERKTRRARRIEEREERETHSTTTKKFTPSSSRSSFISLHTTTTHTHTLRPRYFSFLLLAPRGNRTTQDTRTHARTLFASSIRQRQRQHEHVPHSSTSSSRVKSEKTRGRSIHPPPLLVPTSPPTHPPCLPVSVHYVPTFVPRPRSRSTTPPYRTSIEASAPTTQLATVHTVYGVFLPTYTSITRHDTRYLTSFAQPVESCAGCTRFFSLSAACE